MTTVSELDIRVNLHDEGAIAGLHRISKEVDLAAAEMSGKEAEIKITGDLRDFKRTLKEAEALEKAHNAKLKAMERDRDKLSGAQKSAATRKVNQERAYLDSLRQELVPLRARGREIEQQVSTLKTQNALEKKQAADRAAAAKEQAREDARAAKAATARAKALDKEERDIQRNLQTHARAYSEDIRREQGLLRARSEAEAMERRRHAASIKGNTEEEVAAASLQKAYRKAAIEHARATRKPGSFRRAIDPDLAQKVDLDASYAYAQMEEIRAKLKLMGRDPVDVNVHLDENGAGKIGKWAKAITDTTVRVGPFTTTVLGLVKTLSLIGPIVVGLAGQLGALVGVIGAGLGGALGVATAGAIGFIGAAGGIFAIVKPLVTDFMDARKATQAYNKAVREHGKGSDEAAKKMKILDNVLGDVPAKTKAQFIEMGKLNGRWKELTKSARPEFWHLTGDGIQTVSDMMPMFAKRSTEAFKNVSRGTENWMRSLRSAGGQSTLDTIFGNFNKSIPSIMHALGQLGSAIGHIAASFSRSLPSLMHGFDGWASNLASGTRNVSKLNSGVDSMIGAMRAVGHVTAAAGRVLASFFGASVGSGTDMLERWAKGLNKLSDSMRTVGGQNSLKKFFSESINTANKFWGALKPIGQIFFEWSTLMRPFTDAMLDAIKVIGQVVHAVMSLSIVRGIVQTAFTIFLAGALIGKIRGVAEAIGGLARAMAGLKAVESAGALSGGGKGFLAGTTARVAATRGAVAAEQRAAGAIRSPMVVGGAVGGGLGKTAAGAERLAPALTRGAKAAGLLRSGLTGVGSVLGIANPYFGAAALAATAAALAYAHFHKSSDGLKKALNDSTAATTRTEDAYRATAGGLADTISEHQRATIAVRQAKKALGDAKKGTDEYKLAQLDLRDAQRYATQTGQAENTQRKEETRLAGEQVHRQQEEIKHYDKLHKAKSDFLRDSIAATKAQGLSGSGNDIKQREELAKLDAGRAQLVDRVTAAQNRQAASYANIQRGAAGMVPILGAAEQKLGALARLSKKASVKVALKFQDSGDVAKVASAASRTLKSGVPNRIVTRIVADSSSAEQAVKKLQAARLTPKHLQIVENGGKAAVAQLEAIIGRKLTKKEFQIAQQGGPAALAMLGRIGGRKLTNKVFSILAHDGASGIIGRVVGLLNGLHDKSINVTTHYSSTGKAVQNFGGARNASGRGPGRANQALVGEGRRGTGATEYIADHATGQVRRVDKPTILSLKDTEAVIPTEPAYAKNGRSRLAEFAKAMGIPGFAMSRKAARKRVHKHPLGDGAKKLPQVKRYLDLQDAEDQQNAWIDQAQARIREPEDLVVKNGKDAAGNDLYVANFSAIKTYNDQINDWIAKQEGLYNPDNNSGILAQLKAAYDPAKGALTRFESAHQKNITALGVLIRADKKLAKQTVKGKHTTKAKNAAKRLAVNEKRLGKEKAYVSDAKGFETDFYADNKDIKRRRMEEAKQDLLDERYQRDVTNPRAIASALTSANPSADSGSGADVGLSYSTGPGAQKALADQTMAGIVKEFAGNNTSNLGGLGSAGNPFAGAPGLQTNPANIASAVGSAVSGALRSSDGPSPSAYQSLGASVASGDAVGAVSQGIAASGARSAAPMAVASGGGGGGDKTVNITNHFQAPPADPLTWTKGVEFEAGAAI